METTVPTIYPADAGGYTRPYDVIDLGLSWRQAFTELLTLHGKTWADVVACSSPEVLDTPCRDGLEEEDYKTSWPVIWTEDLVFHPYLYDGTPEIVWAPRNPQ